MKRILAVAMALVMVVAMCVSVSALDESKKSLNIQVFAQDTSTWTWQSAGSVVVALGETVECKFTDFSAFAGCATSADINFGMQNDDMTFNADGDTSTIVVTTSDIVMKANGYDDIVVPVAGTVTYDIGPCVMESWGPSQHNFNFNDQMKSAVQAVVGTDVQALYDYINALTEVTITVTYNQYNDEVGVAAEDPAAEEPAAEEPAAEEPAASEPAAEEPAAPAETPAAPSTGLALAVIPAIVAMAVAVVSKKH